MPDNPDILALLHAFDFYNRETYSSRGLENLMY